MGAGAPVERRAAVRYPFALESGVYRTTYRQDLALHHTPLARARLWGLIALCYLFPLVAGDYYQALATQIGIFAIGAMGLNILTGYTGLISVGHGAFIGVGAYTAGILTSRFGVPFEVALVAAGAVSAVVGAIFGIPSLRLKGLYLAIATLAAQVVLEWVFAHTDPLTNGTRGMVLSHPRLLGMELASPRAMYYLVLTLAILGGGFAANLLRTRVGRAFLAVRDYDVSAEIIGINLFRYKILAFAVSSFYAGITGALWAHYTRVIFPDHFNIGLSIGFLAMVIIGGLGSIMGPVYGTVFMQLLPVVLRSVVGGLAAVAPALGEKLVGLREVVFGATIILFLVFEPEGLAKLWRNVKDYFRLWPFSY